jgi:hypothetical protein
MKSFIGLVALAALLVSCKGSDDAPAVSEQSTTCGMEYALVGNWNSTTRNDTVMVGQDCTYEGSFCGSNGNYTPWASTSSGTKRVRLDISSNNGTSGCLPVGSYVCSYELTGGNKTVHYTCNNSGVSTYVKE